MSAKSDKFRQLDKTSSLALAATRARGISKIKSKANVQDWQLKSTAKREVDAGRQPL
jgi:hypothetical protein